MLYHIAICHHLILRMLRILKEKLLKKNVLQLGLLPLYHQYYCMFFILFEHNEICHPTLTKRFNKPFKTPTLLRHSNAFIMSYGKKHPKSTKIIVLEFSLGENKKEMVWYMDDSGGKMCGQYCVV